MHRLIRLVPITLIVFVVFASPSIAQPDSPIDLTQTFRSPRGTVAFAYPADWYLRFSYLNDGWLMNATVANFPDEDRYPLAADDIAIGIALTRADSRYGYSRPDDHTARDVVATALRYPDYNDEFPDDIREYTINGHAAASIVYTALMGFRSYGVAIEAQPGDDGAALMWTIGLGSNAEGFDLERWIPLVDAIAATLVYTPPELLPLADLALPDPMLPIPKLEPHTQAAITVSVPEAWAFSASDNEADDIVSYTAYITNTDEQLIDFLEATDSSSGLFILITAQEAWAVETTGLDAPTILERDTVASPYIGQLSPMWRRQVGAYEAAVIDAIDVDIEGAAIETRTYTWVVPRGAPREYVRVEVMAFAGPGGIATNAPIIDAIAQTVTIASPVPNQKSARG